MALSRGAKKSGSLGHKIKAKLEQHSELMTMYMAQGLDREDASRTAYRVMRLGHSDGAVVPLPK